ncbi:hypothetical protein MHZ92_02990 [Sporosarcina sp. ACRSL]|uniref:DUF6612 family protein n=1 Tax=Sporosarcina sp. ACRSL TaxID=2918215 RepID=UPI001EF6B7D9|nr:DUF6612 family protein [Sporosarcina sp. ACRSL]MCG7343082.1 hypothetical protein [Sporosarcina sp. ACRSL]
MKKIISALAVGAFVLLLAACSSSEEAQKKMTAGDLLDKSQEAMDNSLKAVRSQIVFDDYAVTVYDGDIENPEKAGVKFDMKVEAFLDPKKIHIQSNVIPRGVKAWNMDVYQVGDQVFTNDERQNEWEELQSGSIEELYGSLASVAYPILDLSKFKEFEDEFILKPIEYGYALNLTLDRDGVKRFKEIFPDFGPREDGFTIVDKMDVAITFNKSTSYVTSFKLSSDMRNYRDGNSYRSRQKLNSTYSYFNDIEDFNLPKEVSNMAVE